MTSFYPVRSAIFALSFCVAALSYAQPASQPLPQETLEQARALSQKAAEQFKAGAYQDALPLFEESYRLSKFPNLLYNIGLCYRKLNDDKQEMKALCSFTKEVPNSAERDKALERIQALYPIVGQSCDQLLSPAVTKIETPNEVPTPKTAPVQITDDDATQSEALQNPTENNNTPIDQPVSAVRFVLPGALLLTSASLGTSALFLRRSQEESGVLTHSSYRTGLALSVGADVSLFVGAFSFYRAVKR